MTPIVMLVGPAYSGKDTAAKEIAKELGGTVISLADPIKRFFADPEGFGLGREQLWGEQKEQVFHRNEPSVSALLELAEEHFGIADEELIDAFEEALEEWLSTLDGKTTPRHLLQTFGTDCVRKQIDEDFWIDYGLEVANQLLTTPSAYERERGIVEADGLQNVVVIPDGRFRNEALPVLQMGGSVLGVHRPNRPQLASTAAKHLSETELLSIPRWWLTGTLPNDSSLEEFQQTVRRWCHVVCGDTTTAG